MPNSNWRLTRTTPHPPSMTLSLSFQTPTEVWMVPRWTAASSATGSIPSPGTRAGGPFACSYRGRSDSGGHFSLIAGSAMVVLRGWVDEVA